MGRSRACIPAIIAVLLAVLAPAASAKRTFHPRVGRALGLVPPLVGSGKLSPKDVASGALTPMTYHGGAVMAGGVTVHTVFWAPPGYAFQGSPGGSVPTYEGLIQQFFTDLAQNSGAGGTCTNSGCNAFSVLPQYAKGTSVGGIIPGAYSISYSASTNSIDATDPYPAKSAQCASPSGTATCITDGQVQAEIDHLIESTPSTPRGFNNLWFVFLPPAVDECSDPGVCGTNAFLGYHGISNVGGHGVTIYAVAIDPIIEVPIPPGADPQGFPDAEVTLGTAAHETIEAMTDPEGAGWMDPNGFEVGDKCDVGPQVGTPLGFASDGSPYNQVINGHQYLIQNEWANLDSSGNPGCVQSTSDTANQLPLPQVNLRQFNPVITGNVNRPSGGGIGVRVSLVRADANGSPVVVARASTTTAADGSWSVSLAPRAPGDDRDEIDVAYSGANAPQPTHQVILTGNGGNPFNLAGWTGWTALDIGSAVTGGPSGSTLTLAPCFQVGELSYTFDGVPGAESPTDVCNSETDAATVSTARIGPGDTLTATSNDNRAFADPTAPTPNLLGGLVSLTVPVGEPNAVSPFTNPLSFFTPTGVPQCLADLEVQAVECVGLVQNETYTLTDGKQRQQAVADNTGTVVVPMLVSGGNSVALSNGSRTLTVLHVAHLKVVIDGEETVLAGGRCQPGDYFGAPPTTLSPSTSAGVPTNATNGGTALTGEICPMNGDATGLPTTALSQTDERSGGLTQVEVPDIEDTSPIEGETVYGKFTALAESGLAGPDNSLIPTDPVSTIAVSIAPANGGAPVFTARNVDTPNGVSVGPLRDGNYTATWTLTDANGDVRLAQTRFIQRAGRPPAPGKTHISCKLTGKSQNLVRCAIAFANVKASGTARVRITRGGHVVAFGQGKVRNGKATVTMPELRRVSNGAWQVTLVLSQPHKQPQTTVLKPKTLF